MDLKRAWGFYEAATALLPLRLRQPRSIVAGNFLTGREPLAQGFRMTSLDR
jgi:hypothetical protein